LEAEKWQPIMDYFSVELINAGGSMSLIRMYFFGTPRIERDGSSIPFQRRRTLALLAYLVVTGRPQSRDGLAALLWPEEDPAAARASLRRELSRLKEILGNDALDADRASVGLCRDFDFWLDIDVFRTRVERVREHSHVFLVETPARPCPVCLPLLAEAVEISSACRGAVRSRNGSSSKQKVCARPWPNRSSSWRIGMLGKEITDVRLKRPGAGWRWTICMSRRTAC
jgi:hypothetical protein